MEVQQGGAEIHFQYYVGEALRGLGRCKVLQLQDAELGKILNTSLTEEQHSQGTVAALHVGGGLHCVNGLNFALSVFVGSSVSNSM